MANVVTEEEVRAQLDGHPVFGSLPEIDLDALREPEPEPDDEPFGGGGDDDDDDDE